MSKKTFVPEGEAVPASQIGATLEALAGTIAARRDAGASSYTYRLLTESPDSVLKKVMEESGEVALAAKDVEAALPVSSEAHPEFADAFAEAARDAAVDHLRYEAADVVYHLMVVLERYGIDLDEFAAELNARMTTEERPQGGVCLDPSHVKRGK